MDDSDFVEITFDLGLTEAQTATLEDAIAGMGSNNGVAAVIGDGDTLPSG